FAARDYGMNLGIAFQLADDLLDFTSNETILGKTAGSDLTEGKMTLPLILLRETAPKLTGDLRKVMLDGTYDRYSRQDLIAHLEHAGALEASRQRAYEFADAARKNLDVLPETEYREALGNLPAFVIERNR